MSRKCHVKTQIDSDESGTNAQEKETKQREEGIIPIVDFNSDGTVNSANMSIMVDHWGTDNSLCDIGPMPWGDGIGNAKTRDRFCIY